MAKRNKCGEYEHKREGDRCKGIEETRNDE